MPALTTRLNWRTASLVVGVVSGFWHMPLFFMPDNAQTQLPIALFMINIIASSVVFGWLFEHTRRSVLPVIVLDTSLNALAGILILPLAATGEAYALATALIVAIALVLLVCAGPGSEREDCSIKKVPDDTKSA